MGTNQLECALGDHWGLLIAGSGYQHEAILRTVTVDAPSNGLPRVSITAHRGATISTDNAAPAVHFAAITYIHHPHLRCN